MNNDAIIIGVGVAALVALYFYIFGTKKKPQSVSTNKNVTDPQAVEFVQPITMVENENPVSRNRNIKNGGVLLKSITQPRSTLAVN